MSLILPTTGQRIRINNGRDSGAAYCWIGTEGLPMFRTPRGFDKMGFIRLIPRDYLDIEVLFS